MAVEESLKSVHDAHRGSLLLVVIKEPDSRKFQSLSEVQGKGKEKVSDVQVSFDLLTLQTPKKVSPTEQYIFQRRTPALTKPSGHVESPSIYASLGLIDSGSKSNEEVPPVVKVGAQDEGQTGPNLGENVKLTVEEQVILEEPASSTGTSSSLQHLAKDFSFGDLFFNDKPSKEKNEKTTTETKPESMVSVIIQQDTSAIPPMTTPVINLTSRPDSPNVHQPLQATATKTTTTTTTTTHPPPTQPQQSTIDSMLINHIDKLEQIMANLIQDNKHLEESLDSYRACLYTLENLDIPQQSMNRDHTNELLKYLAKVRKKKKKIHDSPKTPPGSPPHQPPPPLPPASLSGTLGSLRASGSSQVPPPLPQSTNQEGQSHGFTAPSSSKIVASAEYTARTTTDTRLRPSVSSKPKDLHMNDDMAPDAHVHSSNDEDIKNAHIPKQTTTTGWSTGQVTIQSDFFFNKDLEYLRYGSKGGRPTLSISKMKAAYYPNVGVEQMMPDHMWIEEEASDRRAVRTHMWILSVVRIKDFSMYGYDYMKKIILHRADLNEHIITERDFKYLYLSDFEDLYLLNLQGIKSDQTQLNLTKHRWDATGFEYKHDFMVIDSPRAFTFREKYGAQMIMRFNEIHKFSDDTLHQINKALDYWVKEFKKWLKTRRIFHNLESFVNGRSAPASDHLNQKCTIEFRAKRSSKKISLGHYSIMLASSHTMKSKTDIKSPTHYPRGLGYNLFSVEKFCDGDLEVAFHSKICYVQNLEGDDLLIGGRKSNLYTISISDMDASSPVCLMSKATSTKSLLWHHTLSHLYFSSINDLTRLNLVNGLLKFKYEKDHLCSACERGKSKKASHLPKLVPSDNSKLELLHMDMRTNESSLDQWKEVYSCDCR
uniref:Retrovirus-related Pol polyprotein from transposon TNT 1-94 n=1 Tax=Tanacetum cinerariifolium TaxID=118510 RepID=A0A699HWQ3_TANCI|nr:retrovirus-related Pol polyprotein from transposon TNT 1-94 [Tanacetum cinerariifolium]